MTRNNTSLVSVVIPFYQKEQGVLKRSIDSIFAQEDFDNYKIIVVDDGSPIPADKELKAYSKTQHEKIIIVKQSNAGAGAARNAGLDAVPLDCDYVALMDSDDIWEKNYLKIAVSCMNLGYDLFFADTERENIQGTRFGWHKKDGLELDPRNHKKIDGLSECYEFLGDFFDYAIVRSNIMATSSTFFRFSCAKDLRFDTSLYNGQDRLFKLFLSQKISKAAFCSQILVQECGGVNIFDKAQWGSTESIRFLNNYINLYKITLKTLKTNRQQRLYIK